jgi:hypothetical protein
MPGACWGGLEVEGNTTLPWQGWSSMGGVMAYRLPMFNLFVRGRDHFQYHAQPRFVGSGVQLVHLLAVGRAVGKGVGVVSAVVVGIGGESLWLSGNFIVGNLLLLKINVSSRLK